MESIYEYHIGREEQEQDDGDQIQLPCDCFLIHLYFRHVLQLEYPQRAFIPIASFCQPFLVPCDAFLSLGSTILHDMFSETGVSQDFLDAAVPHILSFAFDMVEDTTTRRSVGRALLPMALVVLVATAYDERDEIERAIRESMEESRRAIATVPAAKSSVDEALRNVRIDDGSCTARECSICLEEFCSGLEPEVVCMPCSHVYHRGCIVRWLQRSHLCPLCRFPMPT
ncbi:probable E3 ubiquitin-protein ligase RHC2A [Alnus glutinosa]|uniref:probable E3 ubiquitin-protein ligase RHC2A n=1 Tax=Alnus glutinosa TaxID=3517 RepID=UPI002D79C41F|nr:probable E3 ubiquitin-protein ligase RHC2A [Alnus glutinosa]